MSPRNRKSSRPPPSSRQLPPPQSSQGDDASYPPSSSPTTPLFTPAPPFCSPRRALLIFLFYFFPCIYLDLISSNYAVIRWGLLTDQQRSNNPDIIHDNFEEWDHWLLHEWPLVLFYCVNVLLFMVPYDLLGIPLNSRYVGERSELAVAHTLGATTQYFRIARLAICRRRVATRRDICVGSESGPFIVLTSNPLPPLQVPKRRSIRKILRSSLHPRINESMHSMCHILQ